MQSRYSVLFVEEVSWGGQAFSESSGDVVSGAAVAALRVDVLHTLADRRSCNEERDGERGGEGGRELVVVRIGNNTNKQTKSADNNGVGQDDSFFFFPGEGEDRMDSSVRGEGRRSLTSCVTRAFFICFGFGRGKEGERVCSFFIWLPSPFDLPARMADFSAESDIVLFAAEFRFVGRW